MSEVFPPSPTDELAPPPAYDFLQQEYDQKIQAATERSREEQEQHEQAGPLDEWESWDEALFEANAARQDANQANQSSQAATSSSPTTPSSRTATQGQRSTESAKAREAMGQDPYYANDLYDSAVPVRPLSIQKKSARQLNVVSTPEKERPSWYDQAQLGATLTGSSSSSQQRTRPAGSRRSLPSLPTPRRLQSPQQSEQNYQIPQHVITDEPEEDRSIPPPPFAPVGESLDGPAYERYPGEAQRLTSGTEVVLSYMGEDPSASPPPSPLLSPVAPVQGFGMRRRDTPPRINSSPSPHHHMQYQAPQATRRPSRQTLVQSPPPPPTIRQQYVPPPPRMDFNPSVAYENSKSSIFGQLPMDTLRRGEGAGALYNSVVAAHLGAQQSKSRQPISPSPRRYAGSIASTVSDYSVNTIYQAQNQAQQAYPQSQQFYAFQDFNASRISLYPQIPVNPIPQYPSQQRPVQASYPERSISSMSSLSQGDQRNWSTVQPQYQQQYYQGQ